MNEAIAAPLTARIFVTIACEVLAFALPIMLAVVACYKWQDRQEGRREGSDDV